jgi:hypothetical protein
LSGADGLEGTDGDCCFADSTLLAGDVEDGGAGGSLT